MRVKMTFAVLAMATLALSLPAIVGRESHREGASPGSRSRPRSTMPSPAPRSRSRRAPTAEALQIDKDGIELVGEGRKKTNLVPPAGAPTGLRLRCPHGICVTDATDPDHAVRGRRDQPPVGQGLRLRDLLLQHRGRRDHPHDRIRQRRVRHLRQQLDRGQDLPERDVRTTARPASTSVTPRTRTRPSGRTSPTRTRSGSSSATPHTGRCWTTRRSRTAPGSCS